MKNKSCFEQVEALRKREEEREMADKIVAHVANNTSIDYGEYEEENDRQRRKSMSAEKKSLSDLKDDERKLAKAHKRWASSTFSLFTKSREKIMKSKSYPVEKTSAERQNQLQMRDNYGSSSDAVGFRFKPYSGNEMEQLFNEKADSKKIRKALWPGIVSKLSSGLKKK